MQIICYGRVLKNGHNTLIYSVWQIRSLPRRIGRLPLTTGLRAAGTSPQTRPQHTQGIMRDADNSIVVSSLQKPQPTVRRKRQCGLTEASATRKLERALFTGCGDSY